MEKLENRLIAFLDVLGFSRLLTSLPLETVHSKYSNFIDQAKTMTFYKAQGDNSGRTNFAFSQFLSDSLVLVSNNVDNVYNVNNFIAAVSYLLEIGLINHLPLRGAIGQGDFLIDDTRNIFLSERLPELVRLEANQEWTGCVICKSSEQIVIDSIFGEISRDSLLKVQVRNNPVHIYNIPLKEGKEDLLALNFQFFLTKEQIKDGINYLIEPKKSNMISYSNFLASLPLEFQKLDPSFAPATVMVLMKTRSGMRMMFLDDKGRQCKPGVEKIQWMAVGMYKE